MTTALDNNLMSLGWYMRRTADSHILGDFYTDVFQLPLLRGGRPWPVTMYWAGEATVFELKSDEEPMPARHTDPASAPCMPIFRVHGLNALLDRLVAGGARFAGRDEGEHFQQVYILDTDDQLVVLRETDRKSPVSIDVEAWHRFDRGPIFDPDCGKAMPKDIQCLDGILMRVKNLDAMRGFYRDIIGMVEIHADNDRAIFDLGDNSFLELTAGGDAVPVPKDRVEVTNSFILRLQDTASFKEKVKANGVKFVNEHVQWKRAHLAYFADPEGRIVGIEQRYAPEDYLEEVEVYPEDVESEERFQASQTSGD